MATSPTPAAASAPAAETAPTAPVTHLLYLHGFRSSPQSAKARLLTAHMREHHPDVRWWCPKLPAAPYAALTLVDAVIENWPAETMGVIGSSLGGYYATFLAERTGCRAVLLNPAVEPARDLAGYVGEQTGWHDPNERFVFRPQFLDELRELHAGPLTQLERYFPLIAKGDEVLDWREMVARYAGTAMQVLEGGDHGLSDFAVHLPQVLGFFGLGTPAAQTA